MNEWLLTLSFIPDLDYDSSRQNYRFGVRASDGVNKVDIPVSIKLSPVNDNVPAFSPADITMTLPEDTQNGYILTKTFLATDADYPPHNIIIYRPLRTY